jgi:chromosome segregation ATPase
MDKETLEQRIKWLDDERRKDKAIISELQDRLVELEGKLDTTDKKYLEIDSGLTRLRTSVARVDDFESGLSDTRMEWKKEVKEQEKVIKSWIQDAKKDLLAHIQGVEATQKTQIEEFKLVKELEKKMRTREEEETRFNALLREMEKEINDAKKDFDYIQRESRKSIEERQKELKKVTDLQSEQTAIRKRVDEMRGLLDLVKGDFQKMKNRIQELETARRELKIDQDAFLEVANLQKTERENVWKKWMIRFDNIEKQALDLDEEMTKLDSTHRSVKRMQDELKDLSELLDRRVNEITEMQRLSNDKFQAEWMTFTADDQKRWKNYTLAQKEQSQLFERQYKEDEDRITALEDSLQDLDDQYSQISKYTDNQLQAMLSLVRDWAGEFEQIMDGFR